MKLNSRRWMDLSINLSKNNKSTKLKVGSVLVSSNNELICSAFTGENGNKSWSEVLTQKMLSRKCSSTCSLYTTVNSLNYEGEFELSQLLNRINIKEIYIGLPDPSMSDYLELDPVLTQSNIYRYPDSKLRSLLQINEKFYLSSKQCVDSVPVFSDLSISNSVIKSLRNNGFFLRRSEINNHKLEQSLAALICDRYGVNFSNSLKLVRQAIAQAFSKKYGFYSYSNDARSIDSNWKQNFMDVYYKNSNKSLYDNRIINVGVGGGNEAKELFSNCKKIKFVDISSVGLENVKKENHFAQTIVSSASDLSMVKDESQDLYISLRTYNSSFFDIKKALLEANRVLKNNSLIIISIANGFLNKRNNTILPGLIIPGSKFIDLYRSLGIAKVVFDTLLSTGFNKINIYPTKTEIFLSAIKK